MVEKQLNGPVFGQCRVRRAAHTSEVSDGVEVKLV